MAYLGNTPTTQGFIPAIDFFSGNGSTTAFTLSRPVASVAQVQATIENVPQNPGTAFTVSGNTITFDGAPPSGTNNIYVYYTSPITQVIQPGQGTVGTAQLQSGVTVSFADGSAAAPSITNLDDSNTGMFFPAADTIAFAEGGVEAMRLDASGNVAVGLTAASSSANGKVTIFNAQSDGNQTIANAGLLFGNSFGFAQAGIFPIGSSGFAGNLVFTTASSKGGADYVTTERMRIDASGRVTTPFQPAFRASIVSSNTVTPTVQRLSGSGLLTERFDIGNNFDPTTSRFTAPVAGVYCFGMCWAPTSTGRMNSFFYVNNSQTAIVSSANGGASFIVMLSLAANDFVEPWVQSSTGGNISCDNSGELFGYLLG